MMIIAMVARALIMVVVELIHIPILIQCDNRTVQ